MRPLPLLVLLGTTLFAPRALAQTNVSGNQSGTWTIGGSPYRLVGDVTVPPGATLRIDPGVEVVGQGVYKLTVDAGATLTAVGTPAQPILFTASNTITGWRGLRFLDADDRSEMRHCIVEYAVGSGAFPGVRGGAVCVENCSPTFADSEFRFSSSSNANRNGFGGGIALESSSSLIERCFIHDNEADSGGGIGTAEYGTPVIRDNLVTHNDALGNGGGGMYFGARSSPIVERNVVMRNTAGYWGGGGMNSWTSHIFYGTYPTIRNNLISFNTSTTDGGGLYLRYDQAIVLNNLIFRNHATNGGGAIYVVNQGGSVPEVSNSIVRANTTGNGSNIEFYPGINGSISVQYCNVEGGYPGIFNFDADPQYVDPLGPDGLAGTNDDDYRLLGTSSCVDAGSNSAYPPSTHLDLGGKTRHVDHPGTIDTGTGGPPTIDVGPHELQVPAMARVWPGVANQNNDWALTGATPGGTVHFAYGLASGSLPIPGCPGLVSGLAQAAVFATVTADANGDCTATAFVPAGASGRLVRFQALDVATCRVTPVSGHFFP